MAGHKPNFGLALLAMLSSIVPIVLVWDLKDKLGAGAQAIVWTAVTFGVIGVLTSGASYGVYGG